jgi:uncharacterized protein YcbK (DUF882 family)
LPYPFFVPVPLITEPTYQELDAFLDERGVEYFAAQEVAQRRVPPRDLWPNIVPTLWYAGKLREVFGPTVVGSGYRDPRHNQEVGGAPDSLHLYFNALDLTPSTGTPEDWASFLTARSLRLFGGCGVYLSRGFVHVDTRGLVLGRRPWYKEYI